MISVLTGTPTDQRLLPPSAAPVSTLVDTDVAIVVPLSKDSLTAKKIPSPMSPRWICPAPKGSAAIHREVASSAREGAAKRLTAPTSAIGTSFLGSKAI